LLNASEIDTGSGEREEIGRIRKASRRAANQRNALIRREVKLLKGSGSWLSSPEAGSESGNGFSALKLAQPGANRARQRSQGTERAVETEGSLTKQQAGNIDPGMEALKGAAVAGE
jgi:hypothetical protein